MMIQLGFWRFLPILMWLVSGVSLIATITIFRQGPLIFSLFELPILNIPIRLQLDTLSALMLTMISILSAVIAQYSIRFLAGESRQIFFFRNLLGLYVTACGLVIANHLVTFLLMWFGTSYFLHQLLMYYPERPVAVMAARKKWIVSRIGDVCLMAAVFLCYQVFGSLDFDDIFSRSASVALEQPSTMTAISVLLAVGAMSKSAQFPFHFWLPETMEAPTPVSAIMHAGIINAGGYLMIRMSPLLEASPYSHALLIVFGSLSAVFGALCMITQSQIKAKLAYSTISQMGMMMLACGLGLYTFALFHIIAHSFYKAYAFLSTGKLVEESKRLKLELKNLPMSGIYVAGILGAAAIVYASFTNHLALTTYVVILALGLLQCRSSVPHHFSHLWRAKFLTLTGLVLAISIYSLVEFGLSFYVSSAVSSKTIAHFDLPIALALCLLCFGIFWSALWLNQRMLVHPQGDRELAWYVYFRNGGYLGLRSTLFLHPRIPANNH